MANGMSSGMVRNAAIGFVAGVLAVATFHQIMVLILSTAGLSQGTFYNLRPVAPFGVPWVVNQMFWGGVWGILFALIADRLPAWPMPAVGFVFGLVGPALFGWTVMATIRHQPMFAGFNGLRMLSSVLINGGFGVGVALIYSWLRRWAAPRAA